MPKQGASLSNNGVIVSVALSGLDRALCYVSRAICPAASQLPYAVPVDGDVVRNMVNYANEEAIAFPSDNPRAWELAVDRHDALRVAQTCHVLHYNIKLIMPGYAFILSQSVFRGKKTECEYRECQDRD